MLQYVPSSKTFCSNPQVSSDFLDVYPFEHEIDYSKLSEEKFDQLVRPYVAFKTPERLKKIARLESQYDYLYSITITLIDPDLGRAFKEYMQTKDSEKLEDIRNQKRNIRDIDFVHRLAHRVIRKIRKAYFKDRGAFVSNKAYDKRMVIYALERNQSGALHIHMNITRPPAITPKRADMIATIQKIVSDLPYTGEKSLMYRTTLTKENRFGALTYTLKDQTDRWSQYYTQNWQLAPRLKNTKVD